MSSAALREQTCHQQINRRLNKVFSNLVAAILTVNYRKAAVDPMSEQTPDPILRRKAALVRQAQDAKGMTPGKTLSVALVQSIDQIFSMPVLVQDVGHQLLAARDLVSGLVSSHLLLLIDGPGSCRGLVALDPQGLAAFIEILTVGQVSKRPAEPRVPTQTDAALVAPMVDLLLAELSRSLKPAMENWWIRDFKYHERVEDYLDLGAALPAEYFQVFKVKLDLADNAKCASLVLAFPERGTPAELMPSVNIMEVTKTATPWLDVAAELNVFLTQLTLPLERAEKLAVGDLLPLPQAIMEQVTVCANKTDFKFSAHLGQSQGMRAIRLLWPSSGQGHESGRDVETEFEDTKILGDHTATSAVLGAQICHTREIATLPDVANTFSGDDAAGDEVLQPPVLGLSEAH